MYTFYVSRAYYVIFKLPVTVSCSTGLPQLRMTIRFTNKSCERDRFPYSNLVTTRKFRFMANDARSIFPPRLEK